MNEKPKLLAMENVVLVSVPTKDLVGDPVVLTVPIDEYDDFIDCFTGQ